jgi:hypothetical protein
MVGCPDVLIGLPASTKTILVAWGRMRTSVYPSMLPPCER